MRSGFVSLIGRPNTGKSTLINALVGYKIAITSNKAQTTRNNIQGIYNDEDAQIVFVDTPGIHKPKDKLGQRLNDDAYFSIDDVDIILFLIDVTMPFGKGDNFVLDRIKEVISDKADGDLKQQYGLLNEKFHSIYNINKVLSEYKTLNLTVHENDEKLKVLNDCIKNQKKLSISYLGADGEITKRDIIPISMFEFENIIYITAFCKLRGAIRHFSLSEIIDYNVK